MLCNFRETFPSCHHFIIIKLLRSGKLWLEHYLRLCAAATKINSSWKCTKQLLTPSGWNLCDASVAQNSVSTSCNFFVESARREMVGKINQKVILKLIDKVLSSSNDKCDQIKAQKQNQINLHDAKSCNCWNSVGDNLSQRGGATAIFACLQSKQWKSTKISFQNHIVVSFVSMENYCSGIALNRFQSIRSSQWKGYFLPSRWIQFPIAVSFEGWKIISFNCNIPTKSRWIKLKLFKGITERQKKSGTRNVSLSITSKRRGVMILICIYSYPFGFENGAIISLITVDFASPSYWALEPIKH